MPKHTERERIRRRVLEEQARTGERLVGRRAPKTIASGTGEVASSTAAVVQRKPAGVINVIRGAEGRRRVEEATETKQGFRILPSG